MISLYNSFFHIINVMTGYKFPLKTLKPLCAISFLSGEAGGGGGGGGWTPSLAHPVVMAII